jgi:subtilase family serine protease
MSLLRHVRAAALAAFAVLCVWSPAAMPVAAQVAFHPVPGVAGPGVLESLSFPPTTAFCRANLHRACYQPFQLQQAYDVAPLFQRGIDGRGQTIVIVDAFGSPTIASDLKTFDATFGVPDPPSFQVIQPAGAVPAFPQDPFGVGDRLSWGAETSLDVEWSHVMAPAANIVLVETPVSETEGVQGFPEIVQAENFVIDHHLGDVISQSFGATEETFPSNDAILDLRGSFINAALHHVTVLGSSGDEGATDLLADLSCCFPFRVNSWPSADPLVTSMGGTTLNLDDSGARLGPDTGWSGSGGGTSAIFSRPFFQLGVRNVVGGARGTPDISMSADPAGGADTFWSFTSDPTVTVPSWHIVGGTSEASPLFAGVVALADQAAHHRLGMLNERLYALQRFDRDSGIVDVTQGNNTLTFCSANCGTAQQVNTTVPGFAAGPGYDLITGLGTVDAARFVPELARF